MWTVRRRLLSLLSVLLLLISIAAPAIAASGSTTVYVTDTGKKYHTSSCSYLKSRHAISLQSAVDWGYTPCSRCSPPRLDARSGNTQTASVYEQTASRQQGEEKESRGGGLLLGAAACVGAGYLLGRRRRKG